MDSKTEREKSPTYSMGDGEKAAYYQGKSEVLERRVSFLESQVMRLEAKLNIYTEYPVRFSTNTEANNNV